MRKLLLLSLVSLPLLLVACGGSRARLDPALSSPGYTYGGYGIIQCQSVKSDDGKSKKVSSCRLMKQTDVVNLETDWQYASKHGDNEILLVGFLLHLHGSKSAPVQYFRTNTTTYKSGKTVTTDSGQRSFTNTTDSCSGFYISKSSSISSVKVDLVIDGDRHSRTFTVAP